MCVLVLLVREPSPYNTTDKHACQNWKRDKCFHFKISPYSNSLLIRPPHLQWESGLIRGVASHEGGRTISKYTSPPLIILLLLQWESGLIRREVTLEGNSLLIIYYLSASKIWPEKTTFGERGIIRGRLLYSVIWDN